MSLAINTIDLMHLCNEDPEAANRLINNATDYRNIHRIFHIPYAIFTNQALNSSHINKIVMIQGTVIKAYQVYIRNQTTQLTCLKCNSKTYLTETMKKKDSQCLSCGSTSIKKSEYFCNAIKSQVIRVQDIGNPNTMSETVEVVLEGDMTGKLVPGQKILLTGVVFLKWKFLKLNEKMNGYLCMHGLNIELEDDRSDSILADTYIDEVMTLNRMKKRKFLISSFCSEIYGRSNVKLGLLLALVGGSTIEGCRNTCHVLMIGDAGTGKSHMLKICSNLISPAILTNGVGTSTAGLTSCAVKQGKEWSLEAGALVLADMGICCIDEFDRLKLTERSGLLEAMEQQTLSVAKAGIISSLNTRCSVIASCNVRHYYDRSKTVSENTSISTPLISRFDLIFGLFDVRNVENDSNICDMVLQREPCKKLWCLQKLKAYIATVKKKVYKVTEKQSKVLLEYYIRRRKIDGRNEYNTVRKLESLVRLTEAHAKLMNEGHVADEDVYIAILLMELDINDMKSVLFDGERIFEDESYLNQVIEDLKNFIGGSCK